MKQTLLATVAVAAVVGFGGVAAAQETNKSTSGSVQEQKGGGMSSHSPKQPSGQAAQSEEKGGKQTDRLGQGSAQEQKGMKQHGMEQKGAQEERTQKGAQEQRTQKGAQEERGTNVKGAQEQRGAQGQPSTTERGTTQQGQAGVTGGGRGGSVQLSEQQRSKIKTIVTEGHAPRFSGNVNFDVRVGTKIPGSVHVVPLPEDIVRVVPEYQGYDYILVRDEILIVDPNTLEIVAVIPA